MPKCGSQIILCDLPVRYDTYIGCAHACRYCFVKRNNDDIAIIEDGESVKSLAEFIKGKRNRETIWCDWDIPIHFGGMSDPFQPVEKERKRTLQALQILAETKYPVVISTKGELCVEEPYLSLLRECNVVMQVSMACSKYDKLEQGAPSFERRLEIVKILSENVKRVNVRCQPYMHECFSEIKENVHREAEAGAYGIIYEGMKFFKKKKGLVKVAGDFCYPIDVLKGDFAQLKAECHKYGLKFYSGENRLREMGDSLTCCGVDGMEGFKPNHFNANHLIRGEQVETTEAQQKTGTTQCFKCLHQDTISTKYLKERSYKQQMLVEMKDNKNYINTIFGR